MTTPEPQPRPAYGPVCLSRILLVIACILFALAALCAGGAITGRPALAFAFGGLAAWALSQAVP